MFIFQQKTGRGGNREVTIHNNISTDIYDQNTFHRYLKLFWLQIQTGNLATYISSMPSPSVTKSEKYLVTKVCEGLEPTC